MVQELELELHMYAVQQVLVPELEQLLYNYVARYTNSRPQVIFIWLPFIKKLGHY